MFFFFKQNTAYEMRISDWSSDVCSSDLPFLRKAMKLPAKSALVAELLVRPDDSPLRMNGSGLLVLNAPWKLDAALQPALQALRDALGEAGRSEEHTSELQSLMRISYAVFCLKKKTNTNISSSLPQIY